MEKRKAILIVNPGSGTRPKDALPDLVASALGDETDLLVEATRQPGDVARIVAEGLGRATDLFIVAGGDGTVNEAANAISGTPAAMAIIPCGSGNGLARSLGIPPDFREAAMVAARGRKLTIDRGEANGRPFYCTFGMGFDAAVGHKFAQEKRRGKMTYLKSAFLEFLNFSSNVYAISIDGNILTERAMVVAVANASQYGNNAYIAPGASMTDGMLDMTVIHDGNLFQQALAGVQLMSGHIDKNFLVDTFRISGARISRLDDGPAQVDGEIFHPGHVVDIKCRPAALNVIASPDADRTFIPIVTPFLSFLRDITTDIRTDLNTLLGKS